MSNTNVHVPPGFPVIEDKFLYPDVLVYSHDNFCCCEKPCLIKTIWTGEHIGRRKYVCNSLEPTCGHSKFVDKGRDLDTKNLVLEVKDKECKFKEFQLEKSKRICFWQKERIMYLEEQINIFRSNEVKREGERKAAEARAKALTEEKTDLKRKISELEEVVSQGKNKLVTLDLFR